MAEHTKLCFDWASNLPDVEVECHLFELLCKFKIFGRQICAFDIFSRLIVSRLSNIQHFLKLFFLDQHESKNRAKMEPRTVEKPRKHFWYTLKNFLQAIPCSKL